MLSTANDMCTDQIAESENEESQWKLMTGTFYTHNVSCNVSVNNHTKNNFE